MLLPKTLLHQPVKKIIRVKKIEGVVRLDPAAKKIIKNLHEVHKAFFRDNPIDEDFRKILNNLNSNNEKKNPSQIKKYFNDVDEFLTSQEITSDGIQHELNRKDKDDLLFSDSLKNIPQMIQDIEKCDNKEEIKNLLNQYNSEKISLKQDTVGEYINSFFEQYL
ncbi:MAG: hypothetical protein CMP21_07305 [Rickettsiales bacterium]|nr:hypothetical protein [Rickettsiales bacterium]|tara:strand:- start:10074 stop:10565 length:492 start_codon:yes stop_codon:yes gene_type:complete